VKKERKDLEEDEEEILTKLQRDDVSTSCQLIRLKSLDSLFKPF